MFIYNETIGIDKEAEARWLAWVRTQHIPEVLRTGRFTGFRLYRVLTHDDPGSVSYCIQYTADSIEAVVGYLETEAPRIGAQLRDEFKDQHIAFRTLLEEIP